MEDTALAGAIARLQAGQTLTPADRAALQPCEDVDEHWSLVQAALAIKGSEHKKIGDDVKPLAQLTCGAADMWMYLQLAQRIAALPASAGAPVVGICAPTGAGKSTLVQLLRMLLERVLKVGQATEVSLDDFLSSQKERKERGIETRWDVNSTNEDFASKLVELKQSTASSDVELPMFEKARDDRRAETRRVRGRVAVVLFEGWRVGVAHPNFERFNQHVDLMVYVRADLEAIFVQKAEAAARGVASLGGHDMYAQYGGFVGVVDRFYRPIAREHVQPVEAWSDVVLHKAGVDAAGVPQHHVVRVEWHGGRWAAHRAATRIDDGLKTVVVGGGQAGLCASYFLQQAGVAHVVLEKEYVGSTWERERWDSFRLVTENRLCAMPGFPCTEIGEDKHGFMPKHKVVEYLKAFADRHVLPVRCGRGVRQVTRGWRGWVVQLASLERGAAGLASVSASSAYVESDWIRCDHVVMAIGGFHVPRTPAWACRLPPHLTQMHSRDYKNPRSLPRGAVVVVGSAQSGTQIATELAEAGRRVYLCLSKRSLRVPRQVRGRDITWWLWRTGMYDSTVAELSFEMRAAKRRAPNPSQAGGRDIRLREVALQHDLCYVGRATGVSEDGAELLVESDSVADTMAKIESFPDDRRRHLSSFVASPAAPPADSPPWLLDDPDAQSFEDLPPMEAEPVVTLPACEAHPLRSVPLRPPSEGAALAAEAGAGDARADQHVSTVIFSCGFQQNFEALVSMAQPLSDADGYPFATRGVSDVAKGLYFLGLPWLHKWKSVTLLGCAEDAEHVVSRIVRAESDSAPQPPPRPPPMSRSPSHWTGARAALHAGALTCGRVTRPLRDTAINCNGEPLATYEIEDWLRRHPSVLDAVAFPVPHRERSDVIGAAVVLQPGRISSLDELRRFGRSHAVRPEHLPLLVSFMSQLPTTETEGAPPHRHRTRRPRVHQPLRASLAAKLGLPILTDDGVEATTYDVGQVDEGTPLAVRAVEAAGHQERLSQFLADETRPMVSRSSSGSADELSQSGLRSAMTTHLRAALVGELTQMGLVADGRTLATDTPLFEVGVDSLKGTDLRDRISTKLGCQVPLPTMQRWSVRFLADMIADLMLSGGGSDRASADQGEAEAPPAEAPFVMSALQQSYMIGREQGHGAWLYWEVDLKHFDAARFTWAVRTLVTRHQALRTLMTTDDYTQKVMPAADVLQFELPLHEPPAEGLQVALDAMRERRKQWAKRAASYPLFSIEAVALDPEKKSDGAARLSFLFDLLVADAASLNLLTAELSALYTASTEAEGLTAIGAPPTYTHQAFAMDKHAVAISAKGRAAKAREEVFWSLRLRSEEDGGLPAAPQLPQRSRAAPGEGGLSRLWWKLDSPRWEALQEYAKQRRLTATQALLGAYAHTLACWSSSKRFTLTLANFGRSAKAQAAIGQLADVVLVDVDLREPRPFAMAASSLVEEMFAVLEHSVHTSGVEVMQRLNQRDGTLGRAASPFVFASVLGATPAAVVGGGSAVGPEHPGRTFTWYGTQRPVAGSTALDTPQVALDHQCFNDVDGALLCHWDYDSGRFPDGIIEAMFESYTSLLRQLATSEAAWESPARLVPPAHLEEQLQIQQAEQQPALLRSLEPLHAPFFNAANPLTSAANATKAAVSGADGEISFAKLRGSSLCYASAIEAAARREGGEISTAPVAVALAKSCAQVVAVLAVLASGRAYVPVGLNQPAERIRTILLAIECAVALLGKQEPGSAALAKHAADLHSFEWPAGCTPLSIDLDVPPPTNEHTLAEAACPPISELAYIIFTSGSTGTPKGVAISHMGACNTCRDINERFGIGPSDAVLSLAALSFDLSVYDLFGVLAVGGRVVMPDPGQGANPEHWLDLLERQAVTVWNTAPPVMTSLLEYVRVDDEAARRFGALPLRVVMLSGDFCPKFVPTELQERLVDAHGRPRVTVYTLGGATEASIWSCYYRVGHVEAEWKSIPYGKPLANQALFVLDAHMQIVPSMVRGEICIGGVGLAEGYWADQAKTAKAFVDGEPRGYCERLYKTGDVGRYMPDGHVEILGRMDFQLKLHGYRIEIGEVEAALNTCEGVGNAVVLPWPPPPEKSMALIGFVQVDVIEGAGAASGGGDDDDGAAIGVLEQKVAQAAAAALPTYMVPAKLHVLRAVNLSANGKVDRKWLQSLHREFLDTQLEEVSSGTNAGEPRTESERRIAALLRQLLGATAPVNVFSEFSDLGIDSPSLFKIKPMVDREFQTKVLFTTLLEHSTVARLASWLDAQLSASSAPAAATPSTVCFQPGTGGAAPFFCVAPVSGQVLCYKELATTLGHAQPFYALQSPGINEGEAPLESVEAIAAALCEQLLAVLARFPKHQQQHFWLGGWSMGGVVAFEMALQLTAAGKRVEQLILMDSPAPIDDMPTFHARELALSFVDDILSCRTTLGSLPPPVELDAFSEPELRELVLGGLTSQADLNRAMLERTYGVYVSNLHALSAYRPRREAVQAAGLTVHLLRASQTNRHLRRYPGHAAVDLGWVQTGLRASAVLLYQINADHYFVTDPKQQATVARIVGRLLALPSHSAAAAETVTVESTAFNRSGTSPKEVIRPPPPAAVRSSSRPKRRDSALLDDDLAFAMETGASNEPAADRAVLEAYTRLLAKLKLAPHLLVATCSSAFDGEAVVRQLHRLAPGAVVHSTTSHAGCISRDGRQSLGLLGIFDPHGRYAAGLSCGATDAATAREAGRRAARQALLSNHLAASFVNELPPVALVNGALGAEEEVLRGIEDILQRDVLIVGGSCADENLDRSWWVGVANPYLGVASQGSTSVGAAPTTAQVATDGVAVTIMWPSVRVQLVMSSCFEPSAARGRATRVEGRTLWEVDGEGAAEWYARHGGEAFREQLALACDQPAAGPRPVLSATTLGPLGRQPAEAATSDLTLVHPARIVPFGDGRVDAHGLECFATFAEGDAVVLMAAQQGLDTLTSHPSSVMECMDAAERVAGCLVVYCAGCALAIGSERIEDVAHSFASALHHPFLGMFTYGEQCRSRSGANEHVNLMYAVLAFGD